MSLLKKHKIEIIWKPAGFHDQKEPDDFVATATGLVIGRVYRTRGRHQDGEWYFNFQLGGKPFRTNAMNGVVRKRQTAKRRVVQAFRDYLETPSHLGGGKAN